MKSVGGMASTVSLTLKDCFFADWSLREWPRCSGYNSGTRIPELVTTDLCTSSSEAGDQSSSDKPVHKPSAVSPSQSDQNSLPGPYTLPGEFSYIVKVDEFMLSCFLETWQAVFFFFFLINVKKRKQETLVKERLFTAAKRNLFEFTGISEQ